MRAVEYLRAPRAKPCSHHRARPKLGRAAFVEIKKKAAAVARFLIFQFLIAEFLIGGRRGNQQVFLLEK